MEKQKKSPLDAIENWPADDQEKFLENLDLAITRAVADEKWSEQGTVPPLLRTYEIALKHMRPAAVIALFRGIGLELRPHKNEEKFGVRHEGTPHFIIADTCAEISHRLKSIVQKKI